MFDNWAWPIKLHDLYYEGLHQTLVGLEHAALGMDEVNRIEPTIRECVAHMPIKHLEEFLRVSKEHLMSMNIAPRKEEGSYTSK